MLSLTDPMPLAGYADRPSVTSGEEVTFFLNASEDYTARVVELIHGDTNPAGPGLKEVEIASALDGRYERRLQVTHPGSYAVVEEDIGPFALGLSLAAYVLPTCVEDHTQQVIAGQWHVASAAGYALLIDLHGRAAFYLGNGQRSVALRTETCMTNGDWFFVAASYDPATEHAMLRLAPKATTYAGRQGYATRAHAAAELEELFNAPALGSPVTPFMIGAACAVRTDGAPLETAWHFNGKIERPLLLRAPYDVARAEQWESLATQRDVVAIWDFSTNITPEGIVDPTCARDVSPNELHARIVNAPTRAVTGRLWSGKEPAYIHAPNEHAAIHFHSDDIIDAGWQPSHKLSIPREWRSGVYALRASGVSGDEYVPFVVRPAVGTPSSAAAVLLPTATYLAYGNERIFASFGSEPIDVTVGSAPVVGRHDLARELHPEWGVSTYDVHLDGSPVCYAGWRRPLMNIRPRYRHPTSRVWQLNADLHLIDWLHHVAAPTDVITDHDLHEFGAELLEPYRVVLTGTHPEYASAAMLDALETYLADGGRLMYLGGNGFYWPVAFDPDDIAVMEVRRSDGSQPWESAPGERFLSFTGEPGGTWRSRGRAPNKLTGVGTIAQGLDHSSYYVRCPDSWEPPASWIFDGVTGATFGDFGLEGGGAAGMEIDCFDPRLGSPDGTYVLASSTGHSALMLEVRENQGFTRPFSGGSTNARVHADMTYVKLVRGGAVFSTGSIAWCGSLSHNHYENAVSRITHNVLSRFLLGEPLP